MQKNTRRHTADFQVALAKLIASPLLCEQLLAGQESFLADFILTEKEKKRLLSVVKQKGMSACCSLYRMNRVTPVYTQLSNTCALLGDDLIPVVQQFWLECTDTSLQFKEEVLLFAAFLLRRIENGTLSSPYLKDVLLLETAMNELSYLPEGETRLLRFEHDIFLLLHAIANGYLQQQNIPLSQTVYQMYLRNMEIQIDAV